MLLAVLAGLTGCGWRRQPSTSASGSSGAMTDEQILAIAREYAKCLHDHGITGPASNRRGGKLVPLVGPRASKE